MPMRRKDGRTRSKPSKRQEAKKISVAKAITLAQKKPLTPICSVCSKIKITIFDSKKVQKTIWVNVGINSKIQDPRLPNYSHTYCDHCKTKAFQAIRAEMARAKLEK